MKTNIRVLIIDDSKDDADLMILELQRAGFFVRSKQVDTERDARFALQHEQWDVILSDHNMPSFTSGDALALLKEYGLDIPFIIVSGKIGEEYAVEAMKSGCYDYIMKDKLTRLGLIVTKCIQENKMRHAKRLAEEQLKESEQWLYTTLKSIGEAVITTDKNGYIRFMNAVAETLLSISYRDTVGKTIENIFNMINEKTGQRAENPVIKVIRDEIMLSVQNDTLLVIRSKGIIPIDYNAAPIRNNKNEIIGAVLVLRDITDRRNAERAIRQSLFDLTETISRTIEFRDPYTAGHQKRAALLAKQVGEIMKLGEDKINELYIGGLLHDIGKVRIPIDILSKPTNLTNLEFEFIKEHPRTGFEIIRDAKLPWNIGEIVLHHHEKLDGSGYPDGISGDRLSKEVRIICVCDVVEAMSTFRPYRPARTKEEVMAELQQGKHIKYDSEVVDIVAELIMSGKFNPWNGH